ncbi:class I SAM-dependent methyltransferase [Glaciimonas immobilis]|uniref:SAM-dependent methyltransferase n=1 Tax=Glaciimonas immobilis TaxID=728004 RepID=A0A840S0D9_9BURK|nr:class I SAM-dependent methyltransferase [Glaciimonas immobilis]KAF3998446.1 class I SAM-dependent methyltransferase [Glaciimonas immobilis]MBB5202059.1 SAM-dependent methyltransferase [Glaciimonas immobilis]
MTKNIPSYLLQVGDPDRERLEILAELYNPGSKEFLQTHMPTDATSILDLGCGHGQMSNWFAQELPRGSVVGIDISDEQLVICAENKAAENVCNAQFFNHDIVSDKPDFAPFDVAYCRFLLMHVKSWECFFQNTLAACKAGGSIFIEEPAFPFFCYPESASLHRANFLGNQLSTKLGLNFDCISPLWRYIQNIDVDICAVGFSQPALISSREKSLLWRSFYQIKDALLATKLATVCEVQQIMTDLHGISSDPQSLVGGLRVIQLHLKKR